MFARLRYLLAYLRFHRIHTLTQRAILAHQRDQLRKLLPYLEYHIPLYQRLLRDAGIAARDIRELSDLRRLPVTSKRTFIGTSSQEFTDTGNPIVGTWVTTSGSTGEPFISLRRAEVSLPYYGDSLHYRMLLRERAWDWTINWARVAHIRVLDRDRDNHMNVRQEILLHDPRAALTELERFAPDVIETHASLLPALARAVMDHSSPLRVPFVISGSEPLLPATRKLTEQALGCIVFDRYGLEETGAVAMECRERNGLHINCESFIVEAVDDRGEPLPLGETGRILVTDLYSNQMPLVRYDTGDRGRVTWAGCACGLESPRLFIQGRYAATLTLDGRTYHQFEFGVQMDEFMNTILQYQIVKTGDRALTVRIIPGPAYSQPVSAAVAKSIAVLVGSSIQISVSLVDAVARVPRGKSRTIVDESGR